MLHDEPTPTYSVEPLTATELVLTVLTMKPDGTRRLALAGGAVGPGTGVGLGCWAIGCASLPPPLHAVSAEASNAAAASERRSR
jgi:hypothetical protein